MMLIHPTKISRAAGSRKTTARLVAALDDGLKNALLRCEAFFVLHQRHSCHGSCAAYFALCRELVWTQTNNGQENNRRNLASGKNFLYTFQRWLEFAKTKAMNRR